MDVKHPRRECPVCERDVAVPYGRYARHDPEYREPGWPLVSCGGSLREAPPGGEQPLLFDTHIPAQRQSSSTETLDDWALFTQ